MIHFQDFSQRLLLTGLYPVSLVPSATPALSLSLRVPGLSLPRSGAKGSFLSRLF